MKGENIHPNDQPYHFILSGEKNTYNVSFQLSGSDVMIKCNCGARNTSQQCWHVQYILAGKTSRITGGDVKRHDELLEALSHFDKGRNMLRVANRKFEGDTTCRRCGSNRIVKIKSSIIARFWGLFKETNHTYFCKECKWTW